MKLFKIFCLLLFFNTFSYSQTFFSVIPDFGGDEMEGRLYNVIPLENEIKLIGLVHDSIVPGFDGGTWPILGTISYEGEYLNTTHLIDSIYTDGFYYFTKRLAFKNDSICYLYDRRNIGNEFLDAYLIKFNIKTGKIEGSKIITDNVSTHEDFFGEDIAIDKNGNIYLINVTTEAGPHPQILTVLDSNFNFLAQTLIPNYGRDNFTKFTEIDDEGNIILIGVSHGAQNSVWFESKLFRQVLDQNYNPVDFQLAPAIIEHSILTSDTYSIIKSKNGDWVCATQLVKRVMDCLDPYIWIPYVVCVSNDFKEVKWETRMFDGNINSCIPFYFSKSLTEVSDGYIFAGSSDGSFGIETSGLLGKVAFNGDSLWLKHYIPLEWDTIQGRWFFFQDIKTTPTGNIVIGGHGSDTYTSRILPWVLHLDKDGCLEPGCNIVSTSDPSNHQQEIFTIYPNPASSFLGINCTKEFSDNCVLSVYDFSGKKVLKKTFTPNQGNQYLVAVPDAIHGQFVLSIENVSGKVLYSKSVFIE